MGPQDENKQNNQIPLFLNKLPSDTDANLYLAGLKALTGEELKTIDNEISHWKNIGDNYYNETAKNTKQYSNAVDAYKNALILCENDDYKKIRGKILYNCALCYYKLQNYDESLLCLNQSIKLNGYNCKKYFWQAQNYLCLKLYRRGLVCVTQGLKNYDKNQDLINLRKIFEDKLVLLKKRNDFESNQNQINFNLISEKLSKLNVKYVDKSEDDFPLDSIKIGKDGNLKVSILFLFGQVSRAEGYNSADENMALIEPLSVIFDEAVREWDTQHIYNINHIELYIKSDHNGKIKVDKLSTIRDIMIKNKSIKKYLVLYIDNFC